MNQSGPNRPPQAHKKARGRATDAATNLLDDVLGSTNDMAHPSDQAFSDEITTADGLVTTANHYGLRNIQSDGETERTEIGVYVTSVRRSGESTETDKYQASLYWRTTAGAAAITLTATGNRKAKAEVYQASKTGALRQETLQAAMLPLLETAAKLVRAMAYQDPPSARL